MMNTHGMMFEAPRGVTEVEVTHGFAQVQIWLGRPDLVLARIETLRLIGDAGVSHKYLQLAPDGLALIVRDAQVAQLSQVLKTAGIKFDLNEKRSMILVKAPGIWEEKGMIASIMEAAISAGVEVDHVGDMHDRMYMVVRGEVAEDTAAKFRELLLGAQP
jgi:hypothetical protein